MNFCDAGREAFKLMMNWAMGISLQNRRANFIITKMNADLQMLVKN